MNIKVTSVSRKAQPLANAAAAICVITQEDIRRSGVTSIPEALRLAPGVQVARIDANKWAISIRGFNGRFANKLLVLMDGRSLYSPLFSGVFWDIQDTVMADIDRIEVIRGPGAALWGANAVNGVINIITKQSDQTKGGYVNFGGGTQERGFATARYGMSLSEATDLRVYGKYVDRDAGVDATHDAWHTTHGGFRLDSHLLDNDDDLLTLQGDYFEGKRGETDQIYQLPTFVDPAVSHSVNMENPVSGGNLLARWQRNLSATSSLSGQLYYDHVDLNTFNAHGKIDIVDMDFQHRFACGSKQDIVCGLGFRFSHDEIDNSFTAGFLPEESDALLYSAFVHDEIALVPEYLSLIIGSRFEHNRYSGLEIQPNGRLLWTPDPRHTVWASVSRALRTPSRGDQDILYRQSVIPPPLAFLPAPANLFPAVVAIYGSPDFKSEELLAYEIGYRSETMAGLSLDIATFYNDYNNLRTARLGQVGLDSLTAPTQVLLPYITGNEMHGYTYGAELKVSWQPLPWWRLQLAYSYLKIVMELDDSAANQSSVDDAEGGSPRHQFSLRSGFDIGRQITLDLTLRGVDRLESFSGGSMPFYVNMDARFAWRPKQNLELAVVGQNLFDDQLRNSSRKCLIPSLRGRNEAFTAWQPGTFKSAAYC